MNLALSVIIPVYNSSEYIQECITSILDTGLKSMEIILIDDGSKDHSYDICRALSKQDKRISVYKNKNGGSASARNLGMVMAKGTYISFVDSDDTVEAVQYAKAFEEVITAEYDLGCMNIILGKNIVSSKPRDDNIWRQFIDEPVYMHSLCNKFFKHTLIEELKLDEDLVVCEDMLFCAKAFIKAKNIGYMNRNGYRYRMVESSVTHSTDNVKKSVDDRKAAKRIAEYYCKSGTDNEFKRFICFRNQIAALRYLTEVDVFSPNEYRKCVLNNKSYGDLKNLRHRMLCWCANNKMDWVPVLHMMLKKRKNKLKIGSKGGL